jgi:hypothetical protein
MKRFLLTALLCSIAAIALAQVLPFPGPGGVAKPPCQSNAINGTYANVVRLYHLNNSFADTSSNNVTGTKVGTPAFVSTQTKFWPISLQNSTSTVANGFTVGTFQITGDFTYEIWVYPTATSPPYQLFASDAGATMLISTGYNAATYSTGEYYDYGSGTVTRTSSALPQNAWHHLAFVKTGSTAAIYLDGTSQSLATGGSGITGKFGNGTQTIAFLYHNSATYSFIGYASEIRVSNVARYTGNFTPPTQAFCDN